MPLWLFVQGRTLSLAVAPPARSLSTVAGTPGRNSCSAPRAPAHPASKSPPGPGGGLSLTGRMAGDSHTWFPRRHSWSRGVGHAYVIAVPSLATLLTQGTLAQDRTWRTNPDVQISSKPNLGPALSSSSGQPQVPPKARGQNRPGLYPRPASPGQLPVSLHCLRVPGN